MRLGGDEAKSPCLQIAFSAGHLRSVPRPQTAFPHVVQLLDLLGGFRRVRRLEINLVHCLQKSLGALKLTGTSYPSAFKHLAILNKNLARLAIVGTGPISLRARPLTIPQVPK